jgi:ketosteroid isomerase-like protein
MSAAPQDQEILERNQAMLDSVVRGDWSAYSGFCNTDLSCFEAETEGVLAEGLAFHRFYFQQPVATSVDSPTTPASQVTMARPHLRWLGDDAVVVSYTRLTQHWHDGTAHTSRCCETRIWQRLHGQWLQVHVHRS